MKLNTFPQSENAALADFLAAIKRRSRALGHKFAVVACERVLERKDGEAHERVEFRLGQRTSRGLRLTCWLWDDRWCWFDVRKGAKTGWAFEWSCDGRLAGGRTGRDLVEAIEATHDGIALAFDVEKLAALWRPLLLRGPQRG